MLKYSGPLSIEGEKTMNKGQKSLALNIVLIFLIFNIISISVFTVYMQKNGESESIRYAQKSSLEVTREKSELISIAFERIKGRVEILATYMEEILTCETADTLSSEYVFESDGTISRLKDPSKEDYEQSNILVPNTTSLSDQLIREINLTEELDKYFSVIKQNEDVSWCYIVTRDNLLRCSPYSELNNFFSSDHSQVNDIFYIQASDQNNPEHKAVWTTPYYDYLGLGWTMTCTKPIYEENGELFGVICIDLPINNIKKKYFEGFSLGDSSKICWMTTEGDVYYHTDYEKLTASQGETFEKNIFQEEMSKERKSVLQDIMNSNDSGMKIFDEKGKKYMIVYSPVKGTDSLLFVEVGLEEFNAFNDIDPKGIIIIALLDVLLAIIFSIVLYKRFSKPMNRLVGKAQKISEGDYSSVDFEQPEKDGYYEIVRLNEAFYSMSDSIKKYTENLIDKNKEISTIIDAIDETLVIVETDGKISLQSKDSVRIPKENLEKGIEQVIKSKHSFVEQIVSEGEAYKNVYYPITKEDKVSKVVVSSECITNTLLIEKEIQQIEKMAGVGQLAAAIVHELKNILALIKGAAYILEITEVDSKNEVNTIKRAVDEAENVITTLLDFSSRDKNGSEIINIGTLINQILLLSNKETIGKGITIFKDIDDECYVQSNSREAIKVILQNIIINAIQAVGTEGIIEIKCFKSAKNIIVCIKDNGPGMDEETRKRIFDPFFTTKDEGNGIGLWITKRLINSLEGEIELITPKEGGTEFKLIIPDSVGEVGQYDTNNVSG